MNWRPTLRQELLGFITLLFVSLGMIVVFVIIPTFQRMVKLQNSITETQRALELQFERTRYARRLQGNLSTIVAATKQFAAATIPAGDELRLITELEALAATYRITPAVAVANTPSPAKPDATKKKTAAAPALAAFTFSFNNQGVFIDQLRYLQALHAKPYYMIIDHLQWEKKTLFRAATSSLILRFDGTVFRTPDSATSTQTSGAARDRKLP